MLYFVEVHANLDRPEYENELVDRLTQLPEGELDELNNRLKTLGIQVVYFQLHKSVVVWILYSTAKSLSELERLSTNGQLDVILTELFNS